MAKKKKTRSMTDNLPNRKYVNVGSGGDSSAVAYESFDTMMGAREGAGWLVSRIDIQPRSLPDGIVVGTHSMKFQVCTGAQDAMLLSDDPEVIGDIFLMDGVLTEGARAIVWPLTWIGPVLVASRQLTCLLQGSDDVVSLQNLAWQFIVWYQWVKLAAREWVEIAEAKGIA